MRFYKEGGGVAHDEREVVAVIKSVRKDGRSRVSKIYKGTKAAWHHVHPV
jgi:hypothetical protein